MQRLTQILCRHYLIDGSLPTGNDGADAKWNTLRAARGVAIVQKSAAAAAAASEQPSRPRNPLSQSDRDLSQLQLSSSTTITNLAAPGAPTARSSSADLAAAAIAFAAGANKTTVAGLTVTTTLTGGSQSDIAGVSKTSAPKEAEFDLLDLLLARYCVDEESTLAASSALPPILADQNNPWRECRTIEQIAATEFDGCLPEIVADQFLLSTKVRKTLLQSTQQRLGQFTVLEKVLDDLFAALFIWRHMLRVLGNINSSFQGSPATHAKAMQYVVGIYDDLYSVKDEISFQVFILNMVNA